MTNTMRITLVLIGAVATVALAGYAHPIMMYVIGVSFGAIAALDYKAESP